MRSKTETMITSLSKVSDAHRFVFDGVAFFGRTLNEYIEMFNFLPEEWQGKRVLDCASGPASFTAEACRMGINAVACDPMYAYKLQDLLPKAEHDLQLCTIKVGAEQDLFDRYANSDATAANPNHWVAEKQRALFTFSRDYTQGKAEGRYKVGSLPQLPFTNDSFDLVLSGHLLFVYAARNNGGMLSEDNFPLQFHIDAIKEMIRVSRNEVRIYPLKGPNCRNNPMLSGVLEALKSEPVTVELVPVDYKDIAGANMMLQIRKNSI